MSHSTYKPLLEALRALNSTGEEGFEGLLRDAVGQLAGQRLGLNKSGPQGGGDAGSLPGQDGPQILVEAKRYGVKSYLSVAALKEKLVDAVHGTPNLDLIVFGATRDIPRNDQKALADYAQENGIGVLFIDWPKETGRLPPLGVLCALVPDTVRDRIGPGRLAAVNAALEAMKKDPAFPAASAELAARLDQPDMGWEAARRSAAAWLRKAMSSGTAALARLGSQGANVLDPDVRLVSRTKINAVLDGWFKAPASPLALLGQEGVGKSWAALSWWDSRTGAEGQRLPLTIIVPAGEVGPGDVGDLLARLLANRLEPRKGETFWRRRLELWMKAPAAGPRLLLLFDGLNENFTFKDWDRLLAQLATDAWSGKVAVFLTCRPDHWRQDLKGLRSAQPAPMIADVGPFDDAELDDLLTLHGLSRDDFVPDVLPLLRVPRLCRLAIRHKDALAESGDITRERLVYEDWKDRLDLRGPRIAVTDEEFREFVSGQGRRLRDGASSGHIPDLPLSRAELTTALGADHGHGAADLRETLSEVIDGRWMINSPTEPTRFKLAPDLVPFALGLALVDQLRRTEPEGVPEALASFVEPLGEQDLLADLLRAAVTVALTDAQCPAHVRDVLLHAWLRRQNFRQTDFDAFWRLIPGDIKRFLRLAERTWLHQEGGIHADEVLIKAFANAVDRWPVLADTILNWCALWLGTRWQDPIRGTVLGDDETDPDAPRRIQEAEQRHKDWEEVARTLDPPLPIRLLEEDGVPWLACRIIGLLSYVHGQKHVRALSAWAVSRAIMDRSDEYDQVAWLLRLRRDDGGLAVSLLAEADRLAALDHPIAAEAARLLYDTLATPAAMERAGKLPPAPIRHWWHVPKLVKVDGHAGTVDWDPDPDASEIGGERSFRFRDAWALSEHALDPALTLTTGTEALLRSAVDELPAPEPRQGRGRTDFEHELERAEPALARWAPDALSRARRRWIESMVNSEGEALKRLAFDITDHLLLLSNQDRRLLRQAAGRAEKCSDDGKYSGRQLRTMAMVGQPASRQIEILREMPDGPDFERKHASLFSGPTEEDIATVLTELNPDAPTSRLTGWLAYLALAPDVLLPSGCKRVLDLASHSDATVRRWALDAARRCNGVGLETTGWAWRPDMERQETAYGSLALVHAAERLSRDEVRARIDPLAAGFLAIREDGEPQDMDAFAQAVRVRIAEDTTGIQGSRGFPEHSYLLSGPIGALVEQRGDDVLQWLAPFMGAAPSRFGLLLDNYPYIDLCAALLRHRPEDGGRLWQHMWKAYQEGFVRNKAFHLLPFKVRNATAEQLRGTVLDAANRDADLVQIAACALRHGDEDWTVRQIRRDIQQAEAGRIARGLWLAGLLDASDAAEDLWKSDLSAPPTSGWLSDVHARAKRLYQRNVWARHWASAFFSESDQDRAYGYHLLFRQLADPRAYLWGPKMAKESWNDLPPEWQAHWQLAGEAVKKAIEKTEKEWEKTLFGTKTTSHVQWPWR